MSGWREQQIRELVFLVQNGLMSVDEARNRLGLNAWGTPETSELIPWGLLSPETLREMLKEALGL